jgi:group I intron endonuclease
MGCVYLARCKVNGKLYVGKTTYDFEFYKHGYEIVAASNKPTTRVFIKALRKYGFAAFEWSILAEDDDNEWLCLMEQKWIKRLGTKVPNGYNHTDGGEGNIGWNPSDETRSRMSKSAKGKVLTEDHRRRMSESHMGHVTSEETRKKISEAHIGMTHSEETKKKISEKRRGIGRKHTEEAKRKISASKRGKPAGPLLEETKRKISEALKGRVPSQATRDACIESNKRRTGTKTKPHTEETKRKIGAANREALKKWNRWRDWESCCA